MHGQVESGNYALGVLAPPYEVDFISYIEDPVVDMEG